MIRDATAADVPALAQLLTQLGYPVQAGEIGGRLARVQSTARVVVAVGGAGVPDGLIVTHVVNALEQPLPMCLIVALVVREAERGRGVGGELLAEAERWAAEHGCGRVIVGTASHREGAKRFYRARGYEETGVRFAKLLPSSTPR